MKYFEQGLSRRQFSKTAAPAAALSAFPAWLRGDEPTRKYKLCAFIKFLQSLSYEELAEKIAAVGSTASK
jgi:hypothetical protein